MLHYCSSMCNNATNVQTGILSLFSLLIRLNCYLNYLFEFINTIYATVQPFKIDNINK